MATSRRYDVFICFRGDDTRNFAGHLYYGLKQRGFNVFKDDQALDRGRLLSPELLSAIEDSRFAVVIFSKNFASSTWCLEEVAHIIDCTTGPTKLTVLPVFYDVDPSEVRKAKGRFGEALKRHNSDRIQIWENALTQAANTSGWEAAYRDEPGCVESIVEKLMLETPNGFPAQYRAIELQQKHYYDGLAQHNRYANPR